MESATGNIKAANLWNSKNQIKNNEVVFADTTTIEMLVAQLLSIIKVYSRVIDIHHYLYLPVYAKYRNSEA